MELSDLPVWFGYAIVACLGVLLGSFTNVLVVRIPKGMSVVSPPSHCPKCNAAIHWWDNMPILSYIILRGRCRNCREPIPVRYVVIEALTGIVCMAALYRYGLSTLLFVRDIPFLVILIAVTFIDLEHRIIPNVLSLGGLVFALATAALDHRLGTPLAALISAAEGAGLGFGIFYAFAWIYYRATSRTGLGGGDIKLLAMLGAFLGPAGVFYAILISSIFGSCVGIGWALATRKKNLMTVAIPYGPFLVIGGLYYYLIGDIPWLQFTIPT